MPVSPVPSSSSSPPSTSALRWVVCLCAEWCGVCRDYRAVFDGAAQAHPGLRFVWLDIEDQADLVGDVEVETFPTLLMADDRSIRFAGPLTPQAGTLSRLLAALEAEPVAQQQADPAYEALMAGLRAADTAK